MQSGVHKVVAVTHLTENTIQLRLERNDFIFKSGQCVNLGIPNTGVNREYSTYSGEQDPHLDFLIKIVGDGIVSPSMQKLKAGDLVELDGAYGDFCLHEPNDKNKKYLFIASGTGVAPFHSFVRTYPHINYTILHGVRFKRECYAKKDFKEGCYVSCVSREDGGDFNGHVTDYLKKHPVDPNLVVYLCGNRLMINDVYELLRSQGVNGSNLFTETFF